MYVKKNFYYYLKQNKTLLFMISPAVLFFIAMSYLPMGGIIVAFKDFKYDQGIFGSPWSGLDNFKFLFISGTAFRVIRNTFLYNLAFIITGAICQIGIAVLLSEIKSKFYSRLTQSLMFLPYFISWVIVGAFFYNIFNYDYGLFNTTLRSIGLESVDVYSTPGYWKYILVFFNNWKWIGYGSILYLGAIMNIDNEMYEAADIDGANIFQRISHITIPCLTPTIIIMVLLQVGTMFKGDLSMFYQLVGTNGLLFRATDVIDTYVFRALTQMQDLTMSSAAAFIQSILNFVTIFAVNAFVRNISKDNSLF